MHCCSLFVSIRYCTLILHRPDQLILFLGIWVMLSTLLHFFIQFVFSITFLSSCFVFDLASNEVHLLPSIFHHFVFPLRNPNFRSEPIQSGSLMESMIGLQNAAIVSLCLKRELMLGQLGWVACVCNLANPLR